MIFPNFANFQKQLLRSLLERQEPTDGQIRIRVALRCNELIFLGIPRLSLTRFVPKNVFVSSNKTQLSSTFRFGIPIFLGNPNTFEVCGSGLID